MVPNYKIPPHKKPLLLQKLFNDISHSLNHHINFVLLNPSEQNTVKFSESDILDDDEYEITLYSPILNGRISNPKKFVVNSSSFSFWEWITTGAAAIILVVTTIYLFEPETVPKPITETPGRP